MNTAAYIGIALVFMIAGAAAVGVGIFLFFFYRRLKLMTDAVELLAKVMQPFAKEKVVERMVEAMLATRTYLPALAQSMAGLTEVMLEFNKVVTAGEQRPATFTTPAVAYEAPKPRHKERPEVRIEFKAVPGEDNPAPDGTDFFSAPTEADIATQEMISQLKKAGVPVPEEMAAQVKEAREQQEPAE